MRRINTIDDWRRFEMFNFYFLISLHNVEGCLISANFTLFPSQQKIQNFFPVIFQLINVSHSPRPLRPTNRKSLNFATWFFITVVQFLSSPQKFSSLPHMRCTGVPSGISPSATTRNAPGSVLFDRQCVGSVEQTMCGEPVRVNSPGCSAMIESMVRSARFSAVSGDSRPVLWVAVPPDVDELVELVETVVVLAEAAEGGSDPAAVVDVTSLDICILFCFLFLFNFFFQSQLLLELTSNRKLSTLFSAHFQQTEKTLPAWSTEVLNKITRISIFFIFHFFHIKKICQLFRPLPSVHQKAEKKIKKIFTVHSRSRSECFCHRENLFLG